MDNMYNKLKDLCGSLNVLSNMSKRTRFTLVELLDMIYENETKIEQLRKEGD